MTHEEIVELYRSSDWDYLSNPSKRIWRRSELGVVRARLCGMGQFPVPDRLCPCGTRNVEIGRSCDACGRPSWCER